MLLGVEDCFSGLDVMEQLQTGVLIALYDLSVMADQLLSHLEQVRRFSEGKAALVQVFLLCDYFLC